VRLCPVRRPLLLLLPLLLVCLRPGLQLLLVLLLLIDLQ
jgi:hypothetical protein